MVSVSGTHSRIVTEAGILYSFGYNCFGQLGLGHEHGVNTPRAVAIEALGSVCAGDYHTVAITRDGSLFTWGSNARWQLGHGDATNRVLFQRLWHRSLI